MSDELPKGWTEITLQDAGAWRSGGTPSRQRKEFFGKGIPWVKSGDLLDGPILETQEEITKLGLENSAAKLMPAGTIAMALYGATIGKLGVMTFPAATNQACANVVPDNRLVETKYLFNYLLSERRNFIEQGQGGAQPNISQEIVRLHPFRLAPLAEQRRIVAKLETMLGKVDTSQQRLVKISVLLKRFRQSILAAACSGRLTADWREEHGQDDEPPIRKLSELGSITGGVTKNAKRMGIGRQVPYLRVANVYANRLELDQVLEIGVTQQEFERTRLMKNDVLFVEGNGSVDQIGRVALWDGSIVEYVHQNHLIKFRANAGVSPSYVLFQMMSPGGRTQLVEKSTSSAGLNTLSISKISDVELPVPPLAEQQEIVRRVEDLFALANQLELRLKMAMSRVCGTTPSLLARAFAANWFRKTPLMNRQKNYWNASKERA